MEAQACAGRAYGLAVAYASFKGMRESLKCLWELYDPAHRWEPVDRVWALYGALRYGGDRADPLMVLAFCECALAWPGAAAWPPALLDRVQAILEGSLRQLAARKQKGASAHATFLQAFLHGCKEAEVAGMGVADVVEDVRAMVAGDEAIVEPPVDAFCPETQAHALLLGPGPHHSPGTDADEAPKLEESLSEEAYNDGLAAMLREVHSHLPEPVVQCAARAHVAAGRRAWE